MAGGKSYSKKKEKKTDPENRKVAKNSRKVDSNQSKETRGNRCISSLSRAVNVVKNALPSSPRKRVSVIRRLANELKGPVEQNLLSTIQICYL